MGLSWACPLYATWLVQGQVFNTPLFICFQKPQKKNAQAPGDGGGAVS